jgi:hypothetical protein
LALSEAAIDPKNLIDGVAMETLLIMDTPNASSQIRKTNSHSSSPVDFVTIALLILLLFIGCELFANDRANSKMFIGGLNWETTDRKLRDFLLFET